MHRIRKPYGGHIFVPSLGWPFASANSNTLTEVIPQILAQGLMALRNTNVMPAVVNSDYSIEAAERGSTIDVPIPSAIAAIPVAPSNVPPDDAGVSPTKEQISLSEWYEAPFFLSDKDILEAMDGTIPMQASEAVKALADNVNGYIMGQYTGFYGFVGTPGTTPFASDTSDATAARRTLNVQQAPNVPRTFVIDPDAEANALNLRAFQDVNFGVTAQDIRDGNMPMKLGFGWAMDQQVPTHTAGTAAGAQVNNAGGYAPGATAIDVDAGTGTLVVGDIITFAGHAQTYVVTAPVASVASGTVNIAPGLVAAVADNAAIAVKGDHVVNLAFHRDAIAFASRPLEDSVPTELGAIVQTASDPVSGLALRLEVQRQHKRTRWSFDILYGSKWIRRQLGVRCAG